MPLASDSVTPTQPSASVDMTRRSPPNGRTWIGSSRTYSMPTTTPKDRCSCCADKHPGHPGRRGGTADRRPRPSGRPVRPHHRGRGAGADRCRVADAAASLPVPQLHDRRRPGPGAARVPRNLVGTAGADRVRHIDQRLVEHQLPDAGRGHGRGRAGDPRGVPGGQCADLDPQQWPRRRPWTDIGAALDPRRLARHARRGHRLRHRRRHVRGDVPRPVADPGDTRRAWSSTSSCSSTQTRSEKDRGTGSKERSTATSR